MRHSFLLILYRQRQWDWLVDNCSCCARVTVVASSTTKPWRFSQFRSTTPRRIIPDATGFDELVNSFETHTHTLTSSTQRTNHCEMRRSTECFFATTTTTTTLLTLLELGSTQAPICQWSLTPNGHYWLRTLTYLMTLILYTNKQIHNYTQTTTTTTTNCVVV